MSQLQERLAPSITAVNACAASVKRLEDHYRVFHTAHEALTELATVLRSLSDLEKENVMLFRQVSDHKTNLVELSVQCQRYRDEASIAREEAQKAVEYVNRERQRLESVRNEIEAAQAELATLTEKRDEMRAKVAKMAELLGDVRSTEE